jgi:hypothetical protein
VHDLLRQFAALGAELVECKEGCAGISLEPQRGTIPRCLVFETADRAGPVGCAVVGLNPGQAPDRERQYYMHHGLTYETLVGYWNTYGKHHRYAARIRRFLDAAGLTGPILWTELAKCESSGGNLPPLQTFRCCIAKFLERELSLLPNDWPLVAAGRTSYNALAYRFATRAVIGVPHPTGSRGHFDKLFGADGLRPAIATQLQAALAGPGLTLWLDGNSRAR